jgi:Protein of unknown function (DUF3300)
MTRWEEPAYGRLWFAACALIVAMACTSVAAQAQDAPDAGTEPAAAAVAPEEVAETPQEGGAPDGALSAEELQALVAPIALYPDLVLVLTLQASLAPLDVVQAQRFLDQYAEDPSLTPDQDWDESVIGLLNYPTVVQKMSDDLEWTQTLGSAVVTQLEGVQDAIQEIRGFMRAVGALESNDQMTVIAEGDIIRIEPADENAVFIPQYDPEALLAALYSTDVPAAPAEASISDEEVPVASEETVETEGVVETEETGEIAGTETMGEPEPAPTVEAVPAAAPAYYPAVAPPPVTYSDPSPSWLGTAATFAGGAVVGGLVGWAIADDDDDDDDGDEDINIDFDDGDGDRLGRGDINVEDNTIVVNRGDGGDLDDLRQRAQGERLERAAREKAQREDAKQRLERRYAENQPRRTAATAGTEGKLSGLATSGRTHPAAASRESTGGKQLAARVEQARAKADPGRREAAGSRPARGGGKAVRAGERKQQQVASAFGGGKSARQAKRDSDRGLKSRSRANTEVKRKRGGGGGAFAQHGGGGRQAHASRGDRGKKSRRGRR